MLRHAEVVGVATVQGASMRRDDRNGMIYTDYRLSFSDVWKGGPPDPFILVKAGGRIGDRASAIAGQDYQLTPGETIVVFASPSSLGHHVIVGLRQGLYRVGSSPDGLLRRETESGGAGTPISLRRLKQEVYRLQGKAWTEEPATPSGSPTAGLLRAAAPGESSLPGSVQERGPQHPAAAPGNSPLWLGAVAVALLLLIVAWGYLRRTHGRA